MRSSQLGTHSIRWGERERLGEDKKKKRERERGKEREMKKVTTSGTVHPATDYPGFVLQPGITARGKD